MFYSNVFWSVLASIILRIIITKGSVGVIPSNQTKLEGETAQFDCQTTFSENIIIRWYREIVPIGKPQTHITTTNTGSIIINEVSADDCGKYICEIHDNLRLIGRAEAYLNIEYRAKVIYSPKIQYIAYRKTGLIQCFIRSNPPPEIVSWTKGNRVLIPYYSKNMILLSNGSLLLLNSNKKHQGLYTCTPFNIHGSEGSSGSMEVLVQKPPFFTVKPLSQYKRDIGDSVQIPCDAKQGNRDKKPRIKWTRNNMVFDKNRFKFNGSNMTIEKLEISDFGYYECIVTNNVATIKAGTRIVIKNYFH